MLAVLIIGFAASTHVFAEPPSYWRLEFDDSTEPITTEQLDAWEKQANEGDMKMQRQFAAAFVRRFFGFVTDCSHLQHGYRCRAMQTRLAVGEKFARQTAKLVPPAPENDKYGNERSDIAYFQRWYGQKRFRDAAPAFNPESDACKEAVRFIGLAVENGEKCAANSLSAMARWGHCMPINEALGDKYSRIAAGCPIF